VGEVTSTYAGLVDAWEIWNEEDHPIAACGAPVEYNPGLPASVYGPLLRDAYEAIRAHTATPIIMGGTDSGQVAYVDAARVGGRLWADAVAIHPYGVVPDSTWCPNPGEDLNCEWGTFRGKLDEYGAATGLPIWITEFGLRTQNTTHQANYLEASFRAAAGTMAFYFCASDAMVPPFGLTYADGTPKPAAYERFQQVAASTGGGGSNPLNASRLHGTVEIGGSRAPSIYVSAWGHGGDFHETYTDPLGIYAFENLDPDAPYNIAVNAAFTESGFVAVDGNHAFAVRDNVELVAGPDAWHGENFALPF
jgi:Glycosyl hydrolase catalytic core